MTGGMIELGIVEVRVGDDESPVVILKEAGGPRHLAIWMTATGAAGILGALEAPDVDHPSSHDLVVDLATLFERRVESAQIVGHQDGVFHAEVLIDGEVLPARPSDALAIAVRAGCPILCSEGVLEAVGVNPVAADATPEEEVQLFREFLDTISPEDFEKP